MHHIYVYGAGGHGHVVAEAVGAAGDHVRGFVDDAHDGNRALFHVRRLDELDEKMGTVWFAHGIGANAVRAALPERVRGAGVFLSVIHPAAVVSPSAVIGAGTVVLAGAVINARAKIGPGCIINTGAIVEHDVEVGSYSHIAPRAVLLGGVKVGELVLVGAGAIVRPGETIAERATVGAGAVVTYPVLAGQTVLGNPARSR